MVLCTGVRVDVAGHAQVQFEKFRLELRNETHARVSDADIVHGYVEAVLFELAHTLDEEIDIIHAPAQRKFNDNVVRSKIVLR